MFCFIVGAAELLIFGCCSGSFFFIAGAPLDELAKTPNLTAEQLDQLDQISQMPKEIFVAIGIGGLLLGVLPGVLYLILGSGVRKMKTASIMICLVMAIAQTIVVAVLFLQHVLGALTMGNPVQITMAVVIWGSMGGLLFFTIRWLFIARRTQVKILLYKLQQARAAEAAAKQEPWNTPPPPPDGGAPGAPPAPPNQSGYDPNNEPWNRP